MIAADSLRPQRSPADVPSRWILLWLLLVLVVFSVLALTLPERREWLPYLVGRSATALLLLGLFWWGVRPGSLGLALPDRRSWAIILALLVALFLVQEGVASLTRWTYKVAVVTSFGRETWESVVDAVAGTKSLTAGGVAAEAVFSVLAAPILEEIMYRGLLLRRWAAKWGVRRALLLSSLVFAAVHFHSAPAVFASGLVYGILYLKTRNLLVPIALHMTVNGIAWLGNSADAALGGPRAFVVLNRPELFALLAIPMILVGVAALWLILRHVESAGQPDVCAPWRGRQLRLGGAGSATRHAEASHPKHGSGGTALRAPASASSDTMSP